MLDIKFIKDNLELVRAGAKKKHIEVDLDRLMALEDRRLELLSDVEKKRARQNALAKEIGKTPDGVVREPLLKEGAELKGALQKGEEELKEVMAEWRQIMLTVPNVPDASVPEGTDDTDGTEVKVWGGKPTFDFEPRSQIELLELNDIADIERGVKVSGFRGYFLKNDGAEMAMAIWQYAVDSLRDEGFTLMHVPAMVRKEGFVGTGYIPQGEDDLYKTQDDLYLSGTGEVATMAYHMDEVVDKKDLPKKFLAFSPCFRREIGAHGKDTKGLIRVHEFFKVEQVILCEANHEESVKWHEYLNSNCEKLLQGLGLPYHIIINAGGDMGQGQVKKYDQELWVPSEGKYREIGSTSYFHDFQTRRLNIRYKDDDGKMRFAHSLNATALPTPRILVSIIESNQQEDGSIKIPEVLQKYMGGKEFIGKKS